MGQKASFNVRLLNVSIGGLQIKEQSPLRGTLRSCHSLEKGEKAERRLKFNEI